MKAEKVIIEKIYDAKEGKNQKFKTLQLRVTERVTNHLNVLLNSEGFEKSKVAFQSVAIATIDKFGLAIGDNLGAKLGIEFRIQHSESLTAGLPGYQPMINPETQEPVTSGGSQVYFKRQLVAVLEPNSGDTFVSRDGASVNSEATPFASSEENIM